MSTDGIPLISTRMEVLGMCQKGRPMLASRPKSRATNSIGDVTACRPGR